MVWVQNGTLATPGNGPERRFCAHVHGPAVRAHGGLASTLCGSVRLAGVSRCRGCCCIRPALWSGVTRMQMSGWLFISGPLVPPVL